MIDTLHLATRVALRPAAARKAATGIAAALAVALLAGCAGKVDSVTVGSVPDDYRTNHPIFIAEKDKVIDLPVGASDRGMTRIQRQALGGFLSEYDRQAAPTVAILVPVGASNDLAASEAANDFAKFARKNGVPEGRVMISSYQAGSAEVAAPVRVVYTSMEAQTNKCGRWDKDIGETSENKHYTNFGCSYQNNLAAQMANPADLLGPRKMTPADAERRGAVIDGYRDAPVYVYEAESEVTY